MNIKNGSIALSTYLNNVQQFIKTHCSNAVWVGAEVTNASFKGDIAINYFGQNAQSF